jgi:hypothetical protein
VHDGNSTEPDDGDMPQADGKPIDKRGENAEFGDSNLGSKSPRQEILPFCVTQRLGAKEADRLNTPDRLQKVTLLTRLADNVFVRRKIQRTIKRPADERVGPIMASAMPESSAL